MKVTPIAVTKPLVKGIDDAEQLISFCARVSNPNNQLNTETADRLLKYCWDHKHVSIFEQAEMTLEIETSRAISAQIIRHRSFVFQEYSGRYSKSLGFEDVQLRKQDTKNRQNSTDTMSWKDKAYFNTKVDLFIKHAEEFYNQMLDKGVAKECARMILPLTTQTRLYMKGNLRSWINYCAVRCGPETQKEHRDVANECWKIVREQFPAVAKFVEAEHEYLKEIK
ncbi:MAG: FAD-dependent thymidylate synthase [Candidatus Heimdallarchaeota archaeon]